MVVTPPSPLKSALVAILFSVSCGVPVTNLLDDFAAIHDPVSFGEHSPAKLWVAPADYHPESGTPKHRVGERSTYPVTNHRQLDQWMLQRIASIPPANFADSLDATGWLSLALLHDPYPQTRIEAAVILSSFAGHWAGSMEIDLHRKIPSGDLATAVNAVVQAYEIADSPYFLNAAEAAYSALDTARFADPMSSARIVHGLALHLRQYPELPDNAHEVLARTGLRVVLQTLAAGSKNSNAEVAAACQVRLDLIQSHL